MVSDIVTIYRQTSVSSSKWCPITISAADALSDTILSETELDHVCCHLWTPEELQS